VGKAGRAKRSGGRTQSKFSADMASIEEQPTMERMQAIASESTSVQLDKPPTRARPATAPSQVDPSRPEAPPEPIAGTAAAGGDHTPSQVDPISPDAPPEPIAGTAAACGDHTPSQVDPISPDAQPEPPISPDGPPEPITGTAAACGDHPPGQMDPSSPDPPPE